MSDCIYLRIFLLFFSLTCKLNQQDQLNFVSKVAAKIFPFNTVLEIFARILFSRIAFKDIFATFKTRD